MRIGIAATDGRPAEDDRLGGDVSVSRVGGLAHITISRPAKRNSLTVPMWRSLADIVASVCRDPAVNLIAVQGAGKHFSAGADLGDVLTATGSAASAREYCSIVSSALTTVVTASVPTVALIDGVAVGGGAELALAADIRLMTPRARLALPLARLGVVPDRLTVRRLLALVGPGIARSLLLEGAVLTAADCLCAGFASRLVNADRLRADAEAFSAGLARSSGLAVRGIKELLVEEEGLDRLDGLTERMHASLVGGDVARSATVFLANSVDEPA